MLLIVRNIPSMLLQYHSERLKMQKRRNVTSEESSPEVTQPVKITVEALIEPIIPGYRQNKIESSIASQLIDKSFRTFKQKTFLRADSDGTTNNNLSPKTKCNKLEKIKPVETKLKAGNTKTSFESFSRNLKKSKQNLLSSTLILNSEVKPITRNEKKLETPISKSRRIKSCQTKSKSKFTKKTSRKKIGNSKHASLRKLFPKANISGYTDEYFETGKLCLSGSSSSTLPELYVEKDSKQDSTASLSDIDWETVEQYTNLCKTESTTGGTLIETNEISKGNESCTKHKRLELLKKNMRCSLELTTNSFNLYMEEVDQIDSQFIELFQQFNELHNQMEDYFKKKK